MTGHFWYDWGGLNVWLFERINHAGGGWLWDHLGLWGAIIGSPRGAMVWAGLLLALALKRPQWLAPQAVLVFIAADVLADAVVHGLLKPYFDFPRPPAALGLAAVHVVGKPEFVHSFPSGHVTLAFTLLAALLPGAHWVLKALLVVYALWIAWSRIAVGAHFPADVLGGALVGVACALFAHWVLRLAGYRLARR